MLVTAIASDSVVVSSSREITAPGTPPASSALVQGCPAPGPSSPGRPGVLDEFLAVRLASHQVLDQALDTALAAVRSHLQQHFLEAERADLAVRVAAVESREAQVAAREKELARASAEHEGRVARELEAVQKIREEAA